MHNGNIVIYVDMDGVLCNYMKAFEADLLKTPQIAYPQSQYGFFAKLEPIDGALDAMKMLWEDPCVEVWLLTSPSTKNPLSYTEKRAWVGEHLGEHFAERLVLSPNKGLLKGDLLVDDIEEGNGQEDFEGMLLHFGSEDCTNWCEAMYLIASLVASKLG